MKKLVALVAGIAFSLGIGLAIPQTFAQTPAPKEEKKEDAGARDVDVPQIAHAWEPIR